MEPCNREGVVCGAVVGMEIHGAWCIGNKILGFRKQHSLQVYFYRQYINILCCGLFCLWEGLSTWVDTAMYIGQDEKDLSNRF